MPDQQYTHRLLELILSELQNQTKLISKRQETEKLLLIVDKLKDESQIKIIKECIRVLQNVGMDIYADKLESIIADDGNPKAKNL